MPNFGRPGGEATEERKTLLEDTLEWRDSSDRRAEGAGAATAASAAGAAGSEGVEGREVGLAVVAAGVISAGWVFLRRRTGLAASAVSADASAASVSAGEGVVVRRKRGARGVVVDLAALRRGGCGEVASGGGVGASASWRSVSIAGVDVVVVGEVDSEVRWRVSERGAMDGRSTRCGHRDSRCRAYATPRQCMLEVGCVCLIERV